MRVLVLLLVCVLTQIGCTLGPVWAPRLEGRVVDERDGRPIPGALVSAYHRHPVGLHGGHAELGYRTTTTDADGRFALPGRFSLSFDIGWTAFRPGMSVSHPEYGVTWVREVPVRRFRSVEISMVRDGRQLESIRDPEKHGLMEVDRDWVCFGAPDCRRVRP